MPLLDPKSLRTRSTSEPSVTLKLSLFLGLTVVWALSLGRNVWAGFFSDSPKVVEKFASLTPFLVVSLTIDSIQGVLSGVAPPLSMYNNMSGREYQDPTSVV